ncbi:hypothetical protein B0T21DRAFT_415764 [Apiosordaria backusii]|uniref:Uncharacterized protein n=1 Tax=Apiosordaria backusii TaxID=314023 RepID=A0AA40DSZ5_9PEZI|nr:hypothetical protein B0T21DRAFT_415764 [Apiosordaria backusii]
MHLFDFHHQLHLLTLDNKWPLPSQIMPPAHNTSSSSTSNPHPTTPTPFPPNPPPLPQPTNPNEDDNIQTLPPTSPVSSNSFPSLDTKKSSYIKQQTKSLAYLVIKLPLRATLYSKTKFAEFTRQYVVFLCEVFKELWYHGWGFVTVVQNPVDPPRVGGELLKGGGRQKVDVQSFVFRFVDRGREGPGRFDWVGFSLCRLGEVLVVGGMPGRLHRSLAREFFPMGLGQKWGKRWGRERDKRGGTYQRLFLAGRKYLGPKGAEDETVVRLVGVVEGEGWELYASVSTWPGLVLFRRAREPGWGVSSWGGSEEGVVVV